MYSDSRKQAIEAAWKCDCDEQGCIGKHWPEVAAERGYDAGRIAGLREAAGLCWYGLDRSGIRDHARALARRMKVRDQGG